MRLETCQVRSMSETPFAFYAWLLGGDGGRRRILQRLGPEANDALDEFLELALGYERKAPASLQGFMAWLRTADLEVKRDMEISRDEVRVMTVHGAKGLEAPVVFLADTAASPTDTQRLRLIHLASDKAAPRSAGVVVWAGKKAEDPPAVAAARTAMLGETEDEYRRLLYVAMTRAADRLIIGGCLPGNMNTVRKFSWYDLVGKGLENSPLHLQVIETAEGSVKRYTRAEDSAPTAGTAAPRQTTQIELPSWLYEAMSPQASKDALLRPSDVDEDQRRRFRASRSAETRALALRRGTMVHRLLQSLPNIASERRADAALTYLARNAADWSAGERDALARQVLDLIADRRFSPVFAPGSLPEIAIVGRLERKDLPPASVSGQIDRLVVTPQEILIVDFKTNQAAPASAKGAPVAYIRQLALYRAVLAKLYPERCIRAALLWTETPELMEISASALDAELASVLGGTAVLDPATDRS